MKNLKAEYKCLRCDYTWTQSPDSTECPMCGHLYVKWFNFEETFVKKGNRNGTKDS